MNSVLVVGSGIAGLQASIDLAGLGYKVSLLEKQDELGGHLRNLSEISWNHQKASEILEAYLKQIKEQKNITVLPNSEILDFKGEFPEFQVSVNSSGKKINLRVNTVILATGMTPFHPASLRLYGHGRFKDVMTSFEVERMVKDGGLVRPSNKETPKSVAFIQCVGSRDCRVNSYCSDFCCNNSVKLAQTIKGPNPQVDVSVFYIDMRTPSEGEMEFKNARRLGVRFQRGKPAKIHEENGSLIVQVEDTLENDLVYHPCDLVVLAIGGVPDATTELLKTLLNVKTSDYGFFDIDEANLGTSVKGVFVAGSASGPKDAVYSMIQGSCAAAKVDILLRSSKQSVPTK